MNYILELNAFYDWLESNPLPSHAIAVWQALMSICNKAGWPEEFTVANLTVQSKAGVSRKQLTDNRNLLVQKGRIVYRKSSKANEAGKYSLVRFDTQNGTQKGTQEGSRHAHRKEHEQDTLFKQNKTKPTPSTSSPSAQEDFGEIFRMYESEGFGPLSELVREVVTESVKSYSGAWVRQALAEAVFSGKRSWRYVEAILKTWRAEGGPDEAKAKHEAAHSAIDIQTRRSRNRPVPAQDDRYDNFYKLFPNG